MAKRIKRIKRLKNGFRLGVPRSCRPTTKTVSDNGFGSEVYLRYKYQGIEYIGRVFCQYDEKLVLPTRFDDLWVVRT